jgi:hypothetical protein
MRYQQFASHAYCVAVGSVAKMASQQEKGFFVLRRNIGNGPRGPVVSMRSNLMVAAEKRRQLPLLTVYVFPV